MIRTAAESESERSSGKRWRHLSSWFHIFLSVVVVSFISPLLLTITLSIGIATTATTSTSTTPIKNQYSGNSNNSAVDALIAAPAGTNANANANPKAYDNVTEIQTNSELVTVSKSVPYPNLTNFVESIEMNGLLKPELPLKPPFRIWIMAQPRTGSTFIMHLLDAIAMTKSPPETDIFLSGIYSRHDWHKYESFVIRTHRPPNYEDPEGRRLFQEGKVAVFTSTSKNSKSTKGLWKRMEPHSLYTQWKENVQSCSKCEVKKYQPIFNMTDEEVERVAEYIDTYSYIRRCCGLQMSKLERMRLHGCNITEEVMESLEYPNCEKVDKYEMEVRMENSGIKHRVFNQRFNWKEVGDCMKFDNMIKEGVDFNGSKFKGCPNRDIGN